MATQNLILGDNMAWMRSKPDNFYDLIVADPEYGIDAANMPMGKGKNKKYRKSDWDKKSPEKEYFDELLRVSKNQIVCGGNYFADKLPISKGWIFWDKNIKGSTTFSDGELIWTSFNTVLRIAPVEYNGFLGADKERIHITQKPILLYKWILQNYAKVGMKICDPNGGSFSSAIACYDLGFDLDIIENDPDIFNDAKSRYDAHVLRSTEIAQFGYAKTAVSAIAPSLFS